MKRLTYKTAGDATRSSRYGHGPGVKKDDLLQRLGMLEDAVDQIEKAVYEERVLGTAVRKVGDVIAELERGS